MRSKKKVTKTSPPRKKTLAFSWILIAFVLILMGVNFWVHYLFPPYVQTIGPGNEHNSIDSVYSNRTGLEQETELWEWEPAVVDTHTNVLFLGLDNRGFSDAVIVVSYDMESYDSAIISIKRDTYIENQTWAKKDSGQDHLAWASNRGMGQNEDYHAGARLTAQTVEELLGIDLHAYASISYDGFINLIDLIGGVKIEVDPGFAERRNNPLPTGIQLLSGEQALIYARHRSNPRIAEAGSTTQDGDRVRRNQRLLKAVFNQCKELETDELMNIVDQLEEKLYTSLDDWDILDLINRLYNQDPDKVKTVVLPGEGKLVYQERIENNVYYYFLDLEESNKILGELGL